MNKDLKLILDKLQIIQVTINQNREKLNEIEGMLQCVLAQGSKRPIFPPVRRYGVPELPHNNVTYGPESRDEPPLI